MGVCKDCAFAKWQRTETGRIRRSLAGECTFKMNLLRVPACVEVVVRRQAIWRDAVTACAVFEPFPKPAGGE